MKKLLLLLFLLLTSVSAEAASRFAVCTAACTWDASDTSMWSASSGGATGASVPGTGDTVTLDAATCVGGVTCTITVNTTVSVQSITMGACTATTTGCILDFSVNNNDVNLTAASAFSGTGTGTRNLKMGNGTWTLSGTSGAQWNMTTTTNLTFTANSSTIIISGATVNSRSFVGGGLTYNILSIAANSSNGGINLTGANTFASLLIAAPNSVQFVSGATQTITNPFTYSGTVSSPIALLPNSTTNATISIASGSATLTGGAVRGIIFTGGATFTATNTLDLGSNSGITITPPTSSSRNVSPGIGQ